MSNLVKIGGVDFRVQTGYDFLRSLPEKIPLRLNWSFSRPTEYKSKGLDTPCAIRKLPMEATLPIKIVFDGENFQIDQKLRPNSDDYVLRALFAPSQEGALLQANHFDSTDPSSRFINYLQELIRTRTRHLPVHPAKGKVLANGKPGSNSFTVHQLTFDIIKEDPNYSHTLLSKSIYQTQGKVNVSKIKISQDSSTLSFRIKENLLKGSCTESDCTVSYELEPRPGFRFKLYEVNGETAKSEFFLSSKELDLKRPKQGSDLLLKLFNFMSAHLQSASKPVQTNTKIPEEMTLVSGIKINRINGDDFGLLESSVLSPGIVIKPATMNSSFGKLNFSFKKANPNGVSRIQLLMDTFAEDSDSLQFEIELLNKSTRPHDQPPKFRIIVPKSTIPEIESQKQNQIPKPIKFMVRHILDNRTQN